MKEFDVYTVEDHLKPVFGYVFQKERKLGRRNQDYLIKPAEQIPPYDLSQDPGRLVKCNDSSDFGETQAP
jgi:hypothetical protein